MFCGCIILIILGIILLNEYNIMALSKPITGEELSNFDDETRELYSIRTHDPKIFYVLASAERK